MTTNKGKKKGKGKVKKRGKPLAKKTPRKAVTMKTSGKKSTSISKPLKKKYRFKAGSKLEH
jgi:hypothetical protein